MVNRCGRVHAEVDRAYWEFELHGGLRSLDDGSSCVDVAGVVLDCN